MSRLFAYLILGCFCWTAAWAQDFTALARVDNARSSIADNNGGVELRLGLSQPVPFRVFTLDAPWRLVMDFSEIDWSGFGTETFTQNAAVEAVSVGSFQPGWSRMVIA